MVNEGQSKLCSYYTELNKKQQHYKCSETRHCIMGVGVRKQIQETF